MKTLPEESIHTGILEPFRNSYLLNSRKTLTIEDKIRNGECIDLPDINNDSCSEIFTVCWDRAGNKVSVYLTDDKSLPRVFSIQLMREHAGYEMLAEYGNLFVERPSGTDPVTWTLGGL